MEQNTGPVDWELAARIGGRLAAPGPTAGRAELEDLVADLRDAAGRAAVHAAEIAQLSASDGTPPQDVSRVLVVDRPRWARANAEMFAAVVEQAEQAERVDQREQAEPAGVNAAATLGASADKYTGTSTHAVARAHKPAAKTTGRAAGAVQVGGVLALLSSKVLGQFDPFTSAPGQRGRLLLVAPNVLHQERKLGVDPADFRLWVALHEQTHAMQFAAAPWLAEDLRSRAAGLLSDLAGEQGLVPKAGDLLESVVRAIGGDEDEGGGVLDLLSPGQRVVFEEVGAVMALLEGHADVTMDEVGPGVVPTVRAIRTAFDARRDQASRSTGLDRVLRRLLGLDAKLAQYRDGATFVRAVRRSVGTGGFNAVFATPANLPLPQEIADPRAWVRRVHG